MESPARESIVESSFSAAEPPPPVLTNTIMVQSSDTQEYTIRNSSGNRQVMMRVRLVHTVKRGNDPFSNSSIEQATSVNAIAMGENVILTQKMRATEATPRKVCQALGESDITARLKVPRIDTIAIR